VCGIAAFDQADDVSDSYSRIVFPSSGPRRKNGFGALSMAAKIDGMMTVAPCLAQKPDQIDAASLVRLYPAMAEEPHG
jgi:hypothetical protein